MSNDISTTISFTVNARQIQEGAKQIRKLELALKNLAKQGRKNTAVFRAVEREIKKITATLQKKVKATKKVTEADKQMERVARKVGSSLKGFKKDMKGAEKASTSAGKSLGFTGLAFGFIGGIAGFAANQIKQKFNQVLQETATIMSEINRIKIFSDTTFDDGIGGVTQFNKQFERTINLANKVGQPIAKMATLLKEVEKAAPANIDVDVLGEIAAGFSILENNTDIASLIADFSTVAANFPDSTLIKIAEQTLAFSKATKLNFNAGAKAIAFSAQSAKRLNTDAEELLIILANIVSKVPGDRGNAGRSLRALIGNLTDPDTIKFLEEFDIAIFDINDRFIGLEGILEGITGKFKELDAANQRTGNQFLKTLGLTRNSITGLLAYSDATDEAKAAFKAQFKGLEGSFELSVAD